MAPAVSGHAGHRNAAPLTPAVQGLLGIRFTAERGTKQLSRMKILSGKCFPCFHLHNDKMLSGGRGGGSGHLGLRFCPGHLGDSRLQW